MAERPSKKQHDLLLFIDGFIKGNGYGPSYREIMRALDYKSVSTVATHVDGLIAKGWLVKKDNSARSLEVLTTSLTTVPAARGVTFDRDGMRRAIVEAVNAIPVDEEHMTDRAHLIETLRILGFERDYKALQEPTKVA